MDRHGDVPAVHRAPDSEPEVGRKSGSGALVRISHCPDDTCCALLSDNGWISGQRDYPVKLHFCRSADPGMERLGAAGSYALLLLGLSADEPALGPSLEHGPCRGTAVFQSTVASVAWLADSGLWSLRTLETGTAGVPVPANTLCVF